MVAGEDGSGYKHTNEHEGLRMDTNDITKTEMSLYIEAPFSTTYNTFIIQPAFTEIDQYSELYF